LIGQTDPVEGLLASKRTCPGCGIVPVLLDVGLHLSLLGLDVVLPEAVAPGVEELPVPRGVFLLLSHTGISKIEGDQ
jgi:hypothetical protein